VLGRFIFVDDEDPDPVPAPIFEPPLEPAPKGRLSWGLIASGVVHTLIVLALASRQYVPPMPPPEPPTGVPQNVVQRIHLPPRSELQKLLPPAARRPPPAPRPTPPPTRPKDRISVGAPAPPNKGPIVLRREDDLTKTPKGRPDAVPTPAPVNVAAVVPADATPAAATARGLPPGLPVQPRAGVFPSGAAGDGARTPTRGPSIATSLQNLERRLQTAGQAGIPSGTGQQMGPLFFDPEGADFTAWINHFKNEVYRNWIVPQPALLGLKGRVDLSFTVERDGRVSDTHLLRGSGTPAFDRAAQNALVASRFQPLPADFAPPSVTIQVTFFYNEGPSDAS